MTVTGITIHTQEKIYIWEEPYAIINRFEAQAGHDNSTNDSKVSPPMVELSGFWQISIMWHSAGTPKSASLRARLRNFSASLGSLVKRL